MRLLDGSPGLWVYPLELNYLSSFAPRSFRGEARRLAGKLVSGTVLGKMLDERYVISTRRWVADQFRELTTVYVERLADAICIMGDPMETVSAAVGRSVESDLRGFLDSVRRVYDDRPSDTNPLLVFKSIEVNRLPRYQDLFPEMRFVHIIRHPFSNYASLKRTDMIRKGKPFWFQGGDILRTQLEHRWIPHARFILEDGNRHRDRHFVVKYEDLCDMPEVVVKDICQWLGVLPPADPALQTVFGGKQMRELPPNPSQEGVQTPHRVVRDMASEFGYEDVLTERERDLILARTYNLARRLGYFTPEEGVRLPGTLRLWLSWLAPDRWELMNRDSKLRCLRALLSRRYYITSKLLFPPRWG